MTLQLTPKIASAAGMDAGNASMRKGGRTAWSVEDYEAARTVTNRLLDMLEDAPRGKGKP